jgi:hypothetical protein
MTGAEIQVNYFSPLNFFFYLFIIFALMVAYYQWQWHKKATKEIKVVVIDNSGSSDVYYAKKEGSSVSITNPDTNTTKLWPISELSTFDMLYPGDGFIPKFLQKKIRTTILDANDWEPLVNRSRYSEMVASPDVKEYLKLLADNIDDVGKRNTLLEYVDNLVTAPTREMIASPAVLGNIAKEKISELAVTLGHDIIDPLKEAISKLGKQVNPMILYIGLGLIVILLVFVVFKVNQTSGIESDLKLIKDALGIKEVIMPTVVP